MRRMLAACTVLASTPSLAQPADVPLGSRIARASDEKYEEITEVRLIASKYGDCVVKKAPDAARSFVLFGPSSDPNEGDPRSLVRKISDGNCLIKASQTFGGVEMRFPGDTMRYALANALFRRELQTALPLADLAQVPGLKQATFDEGSFQPPGGKKLNLNALRELATAKQTERDRITLAHFGECVVRADPRTSHAMLRTSVTTPEEHIAFRTLTKALSACIPQGRTVKLGKATIRGAVALNYYRLAKAPRLLPVAPPAVGSKN